MKYKYFFISIIIVSITMRAMYGYLVQYMEVSSYLWHLFGEKKIENSSEILVLGDSQMLSGISASSIAKLESLPSEKILFLMRPSEQPEGMLDQYLIARKNLPRLKKVYLNLSPISLSKNSVTDAHKELYLSFGSFYFHQLTNAYLRQAYFSNGYDIFWKLMIEVFPFFGLNQNLSTLFGIVISPSMKMEDLTDIDPNSFQIMPSIRIMQKRSKQNTYLNQHFQSAETWTWNDFGEERSLSDRDILPNGSALAFKNKRSLSINIMKSLIDQAKLDHVEVICFDIPFSPVLEEDIRIHEVRRISAEEIMNLKFDKVIRIDSKILQSPSYYTDFTHLNANGRDALKSYFEKMD